MHYSADLPVCKYCNEIIEEDFIEALGESYHEDHFFCSICQLTIDIEVFYKFLVFGILYSLFRKELKREKKMLRVFI